MSLNTFPCNPYPISTEELNKGNNDDLNTRVSALETAVEEIDSDKADTAVIAPEFDAEAGVYSVGDLVMYQGKLYEFTTAHETAGDWDSTEVTEKTVADEVNSVKSGLIDVNSNLSTLLGIVNGTTYGTTDNPLNIDTLSGMYMYLCINDSGLSGDLPITLLGGGTTFLLIGFSKNVIYGYGYGVQIAIDFTDSSIAIRNSQYNAGAWGAWRKIASSAS